MKGGKTAEFERMTVSVFTWSLPRIGHWVMFPSHCVCIDCKLVDDK
jgi:hypothetical protein